MELIKTCFEDGVGCITLNNDQRRNVLGEQFVHEVSDALDKFEEQGARVAILRANPGVKVWSAGHDVNELPVLGQDPLQWGDPLRKLVRDIEAFAAPVIALIEGSVWGGACEVSFACDMILATPEVTFSATPARLGVPYNATGLLTFLNTGHIRIVKEMLFSARPMSAARLEQLGIINHVVPKEEIENFCQELARDIAGNAPLAVAVMKEQIRILAGARAMSPYDFERIQGLRRIVYSSADYGEGIQALKQRRKPVFRGS